MSLHCQVCGDELQPNLSNEVFSACPKCRTLDLHKLDNQVLRAGVIDSIHIVPPDPAAYRLRRDSYGGLVLQGLFALQGNPDKRIWRDIPIVESDLPEEAEG